MEYKEKFNNSAGLLVSKEPIAFLIPLIYITIFAGGGAVVGALISNDKKFGAIIGSIAGFTALGIKYISKKSINLRDNEIDAKANQPIRPSVPMPTLDPNRECPKGSIKLPINCTQGMDARSIACSKESKRLGGFRCGAYL